MMRDSNDRDDLEGIICAWETIYSHRPEYGSHMPQQIMSELG